KVAKNEGSEDFRQRLLEEAGSDSDIEENQRNMEDVEVDGDVLIDQTGEQEDSIIEERDFLRDQSETEEDLITALAAEEAGTPEMGEEYTSDFQSPVHGKRIVIINHRGNLH